MENPPSPNSPSTNLQWEKWKNLPDYMRVITQWGFAILIVGAVGILLFKFNIATDILSSPIDPMAFAGGAVVLVALTLIGVPLVPALVAGAAAWFVIQEFLPK